jgi:cation diffusion facilitator CzcD-associated flavoprotein CzcO
MFPTRDEVIRHLQAHAAEDGVEVAVRTSVQRLDRRAGAWVLLTSAGEIDADEVVVATGYENRPVIPDWAGRDEYAGPLVHAAQYVNARPFRDMSVLVVGAGCSGAEIAYDLVEGGAATVRLAVRTPPNLMLRSSPGPVANDWIGVPLLHLPIRIADAISRLGQRSDTGDLSPYGLPMPVEGPYARMRRTGAAPTIVDPEVITAIKDRRIGIVPGVEALDASGVTLADGTRIEPDAVICATGYRRGLEPLVGHLGVLDDRGVPRRLGADPAAPGLRFVGFVPRPGALGYMAKEGKRAAKAIAHERRAGPG